MAETEKVPSYLDYQQTLRRSFNDVDHSMLTSGFLVGKVGRKITQTIGTTTVANDTATFSYFELGVLLYSIKVVYTDSTQTILLSCERIA